MGAFCGTPHGQGIRRCTVGRADHDASREPDTHAPADEGADSRTHAATEDHRAAERAGDRRGPFYFRFPGGSTDCATAADVALVASEGEQAVDWTSAGDAFQPDPEAVVASVLSTIEAGAIAALRLHGLAETTNAPATADALELLIPELRARCRGLVTFGDLLAD